MRWSIRTQTRTYTFNSCVNLPLLIPIAQRPLSRSPFHSSTPFPSLRLRILLSLLNTHTHTHTNVFFPCVLATSRLALVRLLRRKGRLRHAKRVRTRAHTQAYTTRRENKHKRAQRFLQLNITIRISCSSHEVRRGAPKCCTTYRLFLSLALSPSQKVERSS